MGDRTVGADAGGRLPVHLAEGRLRWLLPHPASFMHRRYERGTAAAFKLGARHGVFCVGRCWALMLVMFAVGVASLIWRSLPR